jgi:heme/copper-type cytochrome/quinol oxidase subunit 4
MTTVEPPVNAQPSRHSQRVVGAVIIAVAVVVVLWGGYGRGWSWTGLTTNATLWAWLKLLALPLALATLPLWLKSHGTMSTTRRAPLVIAAAVFAVFVFLGYWLDWKWTGFAGNTLWDWFEVLLLPIVVATVKFWTAERTIQPWHRWLLALAVAGFVVFVVFAYALPIAWSGFADNTLFDWIRLLLVPLLMPLLIVPAATNWVSTGIQEEEPEPVKYEIWITPDRKLTAELVPGEGDDGTELVVDGAFDVVRVTPEPAAGAAS